MIDLKKVMEYENNFPGGFTDVSEKPYGKLFFSRDNPLSHDSNHALILDLQADLDQVLDELTSFYNNLAVTPRIYQAFQPQEQHILKPYLNKHGFQYQEYENYFLEFTHPLIPQTHAIPGYENKPGKKGEPGNCGNDFIRK